MGRSPRQSLEAAREAVRQVPGVRPLARVVRRIPWRHRAYPWLQWSTEEPPGAAERLGSSGYTFRQGEGADLDRLESGPTWRDCSLYRRLLAEGRQLHLVEEGPHIVSYFFLDFGRRCVAEQVPEIPLSLAPDACFGDEAYTLPAWRGRGIRRLAFLYELEVARRAGRRFVVTYYHGDRGAALATASLTKVGVPPPRRLCAVRCLQLAGFRHAWMTVDRDLPLERALFVRTDHPALAIDPLP
jgi:hypothetical protein